MSFPIALVRDGEDVVPVVLNDDATTGYDVVEQRVIEDLQPEEIVGVVSTDPAAVYYGVHVEQSQRYERMAAEDCGCQHATASQLAEEDSVPSYRLKRTGWAKRDLNSLSEFALQFLEGVEGTYDDDDPRIPRIAAALQSLGFEDIGEILGSGSFGTAALLDETRIIKLTSDASEVQAGAVLKGHRLTHVASVYDARFIRGLRVTGSLGSDNDVGTIVKRRPVGVLVAERVDPLGKDYEAQELNAFVRKFKERTKTWPHQLAIISHKRERARLEKASVTMESELRDIAEQLRYEKIGRGRIAEGVADALKELRSHAIYAIDVHSGNVGRDVDGTVKLFDIGSSSPPSRPKAPAITPPKVRPEPEPSTIDRNEQLRLPGMLSEAPSVEWIGEGVDDLEEAVPRGLDAGTPLAADAFVYHGTQSPSALRDQSSAMWLTDSADLAMTYARMTPDWANPEREVGGQPRVVRYRIKKAPTLLLLPEKRTHYKRMYEWLTGQRYGQKRRRAHGRAAPRSYDDHDLAKLLCDKGFDGWYGFGVLHEEIMLCEPAKFLEFVDETPVTTAAFEAAHKPRFRYADRGYKFAPMPSPLFGGDPILSGFGDVRGQLLRHRNELPSLNTIRISTIFAGMTIRVRFSEAEKGWRCVADTYDRIARARIPDIGEIERCLVPLGLIVGRKAMYEQTQTWSETVRAAIGRGLRDRELRRFLYLESELPQMIKLAKLSFTLELLGQNVCCLDARILNRMFGDAEGDKLAGTFSREPTENTLRRYEAVEDAFLANNPFYRAGDPIGRAQAQWQSWEVATPNPRPETHATWMRVVR